MSPQPDVLPIILASITVVVAAGVSLSGAFMPNVGLGRIERLSSAIDKLSGQDEVALKEVRTKLIKNYVKASSAWPLSADRIQVAVLTAGGVLMLASLVASFIAAASTSVVSPGPWSTWWIAGYFLGLGTVVVNLIVLLCRRAHTKKTQERDTPQITVTAPTPPNATAPSPETPEQAEQAEQARR